MPINDKNLRSIVKGTSMEENGEPFEEVLETSIETKLSMIASNSTDRLYPLVSLMLEFPITHSLIRFHIYDHIQLEIEDMFFRLTSYKEKSFVPIIDLLSDDFLHVIQDTYLKKLEGKMKKEGNTNVFITKNDMTHLINDIFRYMDQHYKESFPAPYHSYYAVLERTSDLEKKIITIMESVETKSFGRCNICWVKIKSSDNFVKCPFCDESFHFCL